MDDPHAEIAALKRRLAELEAQQHAAPPPDVDQTLEAGENASIMSSPQTNAGDDMRDNALGSDNVVLHDITIAENGMLVVGGLPAALPPHPAAVAQALTGYLRTLLERYQFLLLHGLDTGSTRMQIALRAVFINLRTDVQIAAAQPFASAAYARDQRRPSREKQSEVVFSADTQQWLEELFTPDERETFSSSGFGSMARHERFAAPRTAVELIRHHRALVLLGDPGSGKTTVLRHLALGFALARLHADQPDGATIAPELAWRGAALPLPILVQLRRFADDLSAAPGDCGPLLTFIENRLRDDRFGALAAHLETRLADGGVLLMLDGLDEIADDTRRAWAAQAVTWFQSRFPQCRIVLTSRIYAYRDSCVLPAPFQVATLQPLDEAAQDDFIARWYAAALLQGSGLSAAEQPQAAQERSRALVAALDRRERLRAIAANPLLLTMIALLHLRGTSLPQQRAELYQACLLLLLDQWEQQRADGSPAGLAAALGLPGRLNTTAERLALIQPVAYQLQLLGREEAQQQELRSWLLERFFDLADDKEHANALISRFVAFLEGRSGLLIARDVQDRYAFPHKTFQEYLAARELITQGSKVLFREVLAQRHAATWREVILLAVGHLVATGDPERAKQIGWALLDVEDDWWTRLKIQADVVGGDGFYRCAVLAGEIVEELGDNLGRDGRDLRAKVIQMLVELVQNGHLPATERVAAATLLGRLGDPRLPAPNQPAYWCAIESGAFWFGDDRKDEPLQQVALPYDFKIARYTVTNTEYARFMHAGGYDLAQPWWTDEGRAYISSEDHTEPALWRDSRYNEPTQPVVGLTWYEAAAYCGWLTQQGHTAGWLPRDAELRLPTSLEWERAARGTTQQRYPWGKDHPTPEHANYQETGIGRPAPVGCFPRGVATCGAHDMVGNTMEWLATPNDSPTQIEAGKDFTPSEAVLLTYSGYSDEIAHLCCGARGGNNPDSLDYIQGFRVVWSLARSE